MNLKKWLAAGIVVVTVLFLLPGITDELWLSVLLCGVIVVFFIAMLVKRMFDWEGGHKWTYGIAGVMVLYVGLAGFAGWYTYQQSQFQQEILPEIRATIDSDLIKVYSQEPLLHTLRKYHEEDHDRVDSLFMELYGDDIDDQGRFLPETVQGYNSPPYFYLEQAEADRVTIAGTSPFTDGNDPDFQNIDGESGKLQFTATVTKEGVRYERKN